MNQCTGEKDVEGREIMDGDIVQVIVPDEQFVIYHDGWMDADVHKGYDFEGTVYYRDDAELWFVKHEVHEMPLYMEDDHIIRIIDRS